VLTALVVSVLGNLEVNAAITIKCAWSFAVARLVFRLVRIWRHAFWRVLLDFFSRIFHPSPFWMGVSKASSPYWRVKKSVGYGPSWSKFTGCCRILAWLTYWILLIFCMSKMEVSKMQMVKKARSHRKPNGCWGFSWTIYNRWRPRFSAILPLKNNGANVSRRLNPMRLAEVRKCPGMCKLKPVVFLTKKKIPVLCAHWERLGWCSDWLEWGWLRWGSHDKKTQGQKKQREFLKELGLIGEKNEWEKDQVWNLPWAFLPLLERCCDC